MNAKERPAGAVVLKLATSLDGRIALASGASRWITGADARQEVHKLRAAADAVLTGVGTVLADDPQLNARPGDHAPSRQPIRVVLDTGLRTPAGSKLIKAALSPCLIYCGYGAPDAARSALETAGAEVIETLAGADGRPSWSAVLGDLRDRGAQNILIEAGGGLAASALRAGVVDQVEWFRAPIMLGADAPPVVGALNLESLPGAPRFERASIREVGSDLWETYVRRDPIEEPH